MSTTIKFRRGTRSAISTYVAVQSEPLYAIDTKKLYIGDGSTPGGVLVGGDNSTTYFTKVEYSNDFTSTSDTLYIVNTSDKVVTIGLPVDPSIGDQIRIADAKETFSLNNCIIDPNGNKLNESYSNYTIDETGFYILYYAVGSDGSTASWYIIKVSGQGWFDSEVEDSSDFRIIYKNENYTVSTGDLVLADTTSAALTITTSTPSLGYKFQVQDYAGTFSTNSCTITSDYPIDGSDSDVVLNSNGMTATLTYDVYSDGTRGWVVQYGQYGTASIASVSIKDSIVLDQDGKIHLDGDDLSPDPYRLYGTNSDGTKGFYSKGEILAARGDSIINTIIVKDLITNAEMDDKNVAVEYGKAMNLIPCIDFPRYAECDGSIWITVPAIPDMGDTSTNLYFDMDLVLTGYAPKALIKFQLAAWSIPLDGVIDFDTPAANVTSSKWVTEDDLGVKKLIHMDGFELPSGFSAKNRTLVFKLTRLVNNGDTYLGTIQLISVKIY